VVGFRIGGCEKNLGRCKRKGDLGKEREVEKEGGLNWLASKTRAIL
jgi:hypothetical protein